MLSPLQHGRRRPPARPALSQLSSVASPLNSRQRPKLSARDRSVPCHIVPPLLIQPHAILNSVHTNLDDSKTRLPMEHNDHR